MLVHGWPGSVYEFYRILPLLTDSLDSLAFEVICPSIPGYGFSEAPHKQGEDSLMGHKHSLKQGCLTHSAAGAAFGLRRGPNGCTEKLLNIYIYHSPSITDILAFI